jgi:ABC-type uncharacterized transport system permease subunit
MIGTAGTLKTSKEDGNRKTTRSAKRPLLPRLVQALLAPAAGLVLAVVLIQTHGYQAIPTIWAGLDYAVGDFQSIARTIATGLPLYLAAVGVTIAHRAGLFTLGAQGQIYAGALSGAVVGAFIGPMFPALHQLLCLAIAGVSGAAISVAIAWLKNTWNVDEILSSLLSNYILVLVCTLLANGPFHDPQAEAPGATVPIQSSASFVLLIPRSQLTSGIFVVATFCAVAWWLVERSAIGYRWRMAGQAPGFAKAVGINVSSARIGSMAASGALCGIAGAFIVMASQGRFTADIAVEVGWTAIMLALMARSRPAFAVVWVTVYAVIQASSRGIEQASGVPSELALIIICAILFVASGAPGIVGQLAHISNRLHLSKEN